jgi:hypothetical protein
MEPDPFDLPTSPSLPVRSVPSPQLPRSPWSDQAGSQPPQPPSRRSPWPLLAVIGAGLAVVLIISLLVTLLLTTRGGTTTVLLGGSEQTATSVQATSTAEGTPPTSPTGTGGSSGPHATATPRPPGAAVGIAMVSGSGSSPLSASCPFGEPALSGGWSIVSDARLSMTRRNGNGWVVEPAPPYGGNANAFVLCLQHAAGVSIRERQTIFAIAANSSGTGVAACNAGETLVGGGFSGDGTNLDISHLSPSADHTGFILTAANHDPTSEQTMFVYAECLSAPKAHLTVPPPTTANISPHGTGPVQISCPKGTMLSGGGIDLLNGVAVATHFAPNSATTWLTQVQNHTIVSTTVNLYALCLSFS